MAAIGRKSFVATKYSKVCCDHFLPGDFKLNPGGSYRLDLKNNAVPSVFTCTTELSIKRSKLLNQVTIPNVPIKITIDSTITRTPIPAKSDEFYTTLCTPSTSSFSTSLCEARPCKMSCLSLLTSPSKGRVLPLFSIKRLKPDTSKEKVLRKKIKLLQQSVRRKNTKIKNLTDLIRSMKNNGSVDQLR